MAGASLQREGAPRTARSLERERESLDGWPRLVRGWAPGGTMNAPLDVILKRFDAPDETRIFDKGRFEVVHLGGMTIIRARLATVRTCWRKDWPGDVRDRARRDG